MQNVGHKNTTVLPVFLLPHHVDFVAFMHKDTLLPLCGRITRDVAHSPESFLNIFSSATVEIYSFQLCLNIISLQPLGLQRTVLVPLVCVRGCFHSDTKAMKRLDRWSMQWVPMCVYLCAHMGWDSGAIHDLLSAPQWPSLLIQSWPAEPRSALFHFCWGISILVFSYVFWIITVLYFYPTHLPK